MRSEETGGGVRVGPPLSRRSQNGKYLGQKKYRAKFCGEEMKRLIEYYRWLFKPFDVEYWSNELTQDFKRRVEEVFDVRGDVQIHLN